MRRVGVTDGSSNEARCCEPIWEVDHVNEMGGRIVDGWMSSGTSTRLVSAKAGIDVDDDAQDG